MPIQSDVLTSDTPKGMFALNCAVMLQHGILLLLVGPMVPNIIETFGIGEGAVGILLAMGSFGFLIGPLIAGGLIDGVGVRWALLIGMAIETVFLVLFGVSQVFVLAAVANFLYHFGASFLETSANVMPTLSTGAGSAHSRMNYVHMFFSVGAFIGPFLIGLYLNATGLWRPVFFFALIPTAALVAWTLFTRIPSANKRTTTSIGLLADVITDSSVVFGSATLLLYVGAEVGVSSWIVYYLQRILLMDTVASSTGLSVLWLFIMVGRYLNGVLGNRFSARALVAASGVVGFLATLGFIFVRAVVPAYSLIAVIGLCLAGVFPNVMAEINGKRPERTGTVTAVMAMGAGLGAMLFQWLVGVVAEAAGIRIAFVIPAILQLLSVVTFFIAVRLAEHR